MRIVLLVLAMLFSCFPYTQIIDSGSYTQPYALVFSTLGMFSAVDLLSKYFPRDDFFMLLLFAIVGVAIFMLTALPGPSAQDFKYLLIYASPLVFCTASFALAVDRPLLVDRILMAAASVWMFVGVVQTLIDPTFMARFVGQWEDAASVVVESGRGTLGLAPEPTHHGFHMIILGAALAIVRQRKVMPLLCVASALLVARSSSSLLAIALGSVAYLLIYTQKARVFLIGIVPAYFTVELIVESGVLPDSLRIVQILQTFFDDPMRLLTSDNSVNQRIGGIVVGAYEAVSSFLIPHGLDNQDWLDQIGRIYSTFPWLNDLSSAGIPSGLLIVIYQTGWFGLILLVPILRSMMKGHATVLAKWLMAVILFVFLSQYYISTPGFGVIYGLVLARRVRSRLALPAPPANPVVVTRPPPRRPALT